MDRAFFACQPRFCNTLLVADDLTKFLNHLLSSWFNKTLCMVSNSCLHSETWIETKQRDTFRRECKKKIVGGEGGGETTSFTNGRKRSFLLKMSVSFLLLVSVQSTSTAITLLSLVNVLSLFYAVLDDTCKSSIKLTTRLAYELAHPSHNGTLLAENHYHIFLRPNNRVEIFFISHFLYESRRVLPK